MLRGDIIGVFNELNIFLELFNDLLKVCVKEKKVVKISSIS